ncbi:hypothetical protein cypCar_00014689 [Cyprinus carpio]|nr:hypothetical protein cypCar_00014689 [Cyprinus carpio]
MGTEQFHSQNKVSCVLCEKSDETQITGPLSSKEGTSAHENCLLYASGIYCKTSPTYDDLFGFAVEDLCHHCKKNGATAGCDLKRCKRSYHFPCAMEARATVDEDIDKGRFKSSEVSVSKRKRNSPIVIDSDDDIEDTLNPIYAPLEEYIEDRKSPNQYNRVYDSPVRSAEVETPKRKKIKYIIDSDDESPTSTDRVVAPAVSATEESMLPKQPSQSTPVPEKTRPCEELNPSTTEYSLEASSPAGAAPAAMCTSPGSVAAPELEETPSTSRTSPPPRAQTTDPVSPGTTDPTPNQDQASDGPTELEKQERDLQRKKAALRDAKAVLGV